MKKSPTKPSAKPSKVTHQKSMLSATNARREFFKLIETAQQPGQEITITVDGEPKVVMLSYEDYEGLMETLEIMSDPEAVKGIKDGLEDSKHGRMHKWEDVKKELNLP
ncbi:MAG: type II toxin-antitoxin system Phd/YefM family antitoxin [Candidatus Peregrinibacteria bacterium]|nr:type II toxin-antitoxin system Phd/YefM family antitoxin [Candidatus Peregrinibacteria bacterium]